MRNWTLVTRQTSNDELETLLWEARKTYHLNKRAMVTGEWQRTRNDSYAESARQAANYYSGVLVNR